MTIRWQFWILGLVLVVLVVLASDWMLATARLGNIVIESWLDPPTVVADGHSSTTITIRITENGEPRAGALVQSWIVKGNGLLIPGWVFTDEKGVAEITFTPNPYSPYDPLDFCEVQVKDVSVGRLIEVGKSVVVQLPVLKPKE